MREWFYMFAILGLWAVFMFSMVHTFFPQEAHNTNTYATTHLNHM